MTTHFTRNIVAGIVVILPIAGMVLTITYMESAIATSWLAKQAFYFPGFGLLAACIFVYLVGLIATTVVGRWLWKRIDLMFSGVPALGSLYQTLKQILGYGEGKDAVFQKVVKVHGEVEGAYEIGLLTTLNTHDDTVSVFIPGAPNPTNGRLILVKPSVIEELDVPVGEVMRYLVSLGKSGFNISNQQQIQPK